MNASVIEPTNLYTFGKIATSGSISGLPQESPYFIEQAICKPITYPKKRSRFEKINPLLKEEFLKVESGFVSQESSEDRLSGIIRLLEKDILVPRIGFTSKISQESSAETVYWAEYEKARHKNPLEELNLNKKVFEANFESLIEEYEGSYVAVVDKKIVDNDMNKFHLLDRIYEKYGYRTVYVEKVTREKKVAKLPSPHIVH